MAGLILTVVALIPGALGRRLNGLRRRFDPEGLERIAAHVPLVAPFEARAPLQALERRCWRVCHESAPFDVELGALAIDEGAGLVCAEVVSGANELLALRERLLTGLDAPPAQAAASYVPRVVVAQPARLSDLAVARREAAGRRLDAGFFLERIDLLARYPDGTWYQRDFYTLDRAAVRA